MNDTGASEDSAHEHIKHLIDETWKKLNTVDVENSFYPRVLMEIAKNIARMAQCIYQHGDGHGAEHQKINDIVMSLLIQPISMQPI